MKRILSIAGVAVIAIATLFTPQAAFANSPGQLSNAATNYEVRNVTTNGTYAQSASATCDQTVKYSVLLANSDFGLLKNLTVKANLSTGDINASATNVSSETTSVSGKATVNVAKGTLVYVPGSTVRITADGKTTTPVADGITAGGANVGDLIGSTQTFVQFQAKVSCPTTPPVQPEKPVESPKELPQTGVGENILAIVGAGAIAAGAAYYVASRRTL